MDLSPDQQLACDTLLEAGLRKHEQVLTLAGYAGTGKTTLLEHLIPLFREEGYQIRLLAPTGRAAVRMREVTGFDANTIHSALYKAVFENDKGDPIFSDPKPIVEVPSLVVFDESSMIDETTYHEIRRQLPAHSIALFVGDPEQIPPVKGKRGPDLDHPTAKLTVVHRQGEGSPIVTVATEVRQGIRLRQGAFGEGYLRKKGSLSEAAAWLGQRIEAGIDATLITWTNDSRQRLNLLVRQDRGLRNLGPIAIGDRIIGLSNQKILGIMNGDVLSALDVLPFDASPARPWADRLGIVPTEVDRSLLYVTLGGLPEEEKKHAFIDPSALGTTNLLFRKKTAGLRAVSPKRILHADHGFALTGHKSQGSQWAEVGIVLDGMSHFLAAKDTTFARRLLYTMVTRARTTLRVFDA